MERCTVNTGILYIITSSVLLLYTVQYGTVHVVGGHKKERRKEKRKEIIQNNNIFYLVYTFYIFIHYMYYTVLHLLSCTVSPMTAVA